MLPGQPNGIFVLGRTKPKVLDKKSGSGTQLCGAGRCWGRMSQRKDGEGGG